MCVIKQLFYEKKYDVKMSKYHEKKKYEKNLDKICYMTKPFCHSKI